MILSIHIPKTAGTTFRDCLRRAFGARLLLDYSDLPGVSSPEAVERRQMLQMKVNTRATDIEREFDVIHGHYLPAKYQGLFAEIRCLTFVRDPYQHTVSTYFHAQRETHPSLDRDGLRAKDLSILEFVKSIGSLQAFYLSESAIDDFELVGVTEEFDRSLVLFRKMFNVPVQWDGNRHNVNPDRPPTDYEISDELQRAIERYREQDVALYRKANERLAKLARHHDI